MISSLGAEEINFEGDEACDAFVSVSGKALGSLPGAGIVGLSEQLHDLFLQNRESHSTLCLTAAIRAMQDQGETPFTPAVSVFAALRVALERIELEGLDNKIQRHRDDIETLCSVAARWGFRPVKSSFFSSTTRTFSVSENTAEFASFLRYLKLKKFEVFGNSKYNTHSFQLSSMGWFERPLKEVFSEKRTIAEFEADL